PAARRSNRLGKVSRCIWTILSAHWSQIPKSQKNFVGFFPRLLSPPHRGVSSGGHPQGATQGGGVSLRPRQVRNHTTHNLADVLHVVEGIEPQLILCVVCIGNAGVRINVLRRECEPSGCRSRSIFTAAQCGPRKGVFPANEWGAP